MVVKSPRFSCLFALLTSSVVVPCLVYVLFTSDLMPFPGYGTKKSNHKDMNEAAVDEESFWAYQERNRKRVQQQCSDYQLNQVEVEALPNKTLSSIIVDDQLRVLYCQTPKVACTNWRRIFLVLTGQMNSTNPLDIRSDDAHHKYKNKLRYLSQYKPGEIRHRLRQYFKFMISREPLERILSAYRNKFIMEYSSSFQRAYGRKIIKRYRKDATKEAKERGDDVRFAEFIQYLLDPRTVLEKPLNEHWIQQHKLCYPCTINYDVIGRYETLTSDATHILQRLNVPRNVSFPSRSSTYSHSKTSNELFKFFQQVPRESLRDLYQMYYLDYSFFEYPYPHFLRALNVSQDQHSVTRASRPRH